MFSDLFLPTFPYLEMQLYNEIKSRGIEVIYVLRNGDIRLTDKKLAKTFSNLNLRLIKTPSQILSLLSKGDLLLMRFAYKGYGGDVATKARSAGHKILMYDPSGIDIRVRACPAQYLTAKSDSLKKKTMAKFPRQYKGVYVTGTIHCDAATVTKVDRSAFMHSYGLNPNKKFAILTPANPGEAWMDGLIDDYKRIVEIVKNKCPDYDLAIKCHPSDYVAKYKPQPGIVHKNQHYGGRNSWEVIDPSLTVIRAEQGYMALKACDVVLNVRSSIAMETCLFEKPLININRAKYITNWPFDSKIMMDIEMDELEYVLNAGSYFVNSDACKKYCEVENFSSDGRAYVRTVDVAERILKR